MELRDRSNNSLEKMMNSNRVSLVFPAFNRLEFTKQSWCALMENTDWNLVEEFHVYDDGSTDGTREWLEGQIDERFCSHTRKGDEWAPVGLQYHRTGFRSPMGITLDWIKRSTAPLLAKIDNDAIYPPGWLNVALGIIERNPDLEMLGLECMRQPIAPVDIRPGGRWETGIPGIAAAEFGYLPARYVSGLGIYRREAFTSLPGDGGYFGFEEWMEAKKKKCGWILPSLPVFLLDRMPIDPWKSLSEEYMRKGWQRAWDLRYRQDRPEYTHIRPIEAMWNWWKPVE